MILRKRRNPAVLLAAAALFLWTLPADAECTLSMGEIGASSEFGKFKDQLPFTDEANRPEVFGFILGRQTRFLGDSRSRREMFDCVFEYIERMFVALAVADHSDPMQPIERFRSAALGLTSDGELREAGIDPDREVKSIFEDTGGQWLGLLDAPAVCLGNGLDADCILVRNEIALSIERDADTVAGTAAVTLNRPGETGCPHWTISSTIELTGDLVGEERRRIEGTVRVTSHVEGYAGSGCNPFVRDVPIEGTWNGRMDGDRIVGRLVMPGPSGDAPVPFELEAR